MSQSDVDALAKWATETEEGRTAMAGEKAEQVARALGGQYDAKREMASVQDAEGVWRYYESFRTATGMQAIIADIERRGWYMDAEFFPGNGWEVTVVNDFKVASTLADALIDAYLAATTEEK